MTGGHYSRGAYSSSALADGLTSMKPPSTTKLAPVVHAAPSEQSQVMQPAISRASPGRRSGTVTIATGMTAAYPGARPPNSTDGQTDARTGADGLPTRPRLH